MPNGEEAAVASVFIQVFQPRVLKSCLIYYYSVSVLTLCIHIFLGIDYLELTFVPFIIY